MAVWRLKSLEYASEASFAVNAENPSANAWDQKIPAENIILTIAQERMPDMAMRDRTDERGLSHLGVRTGTLEFDTNICGHFTDPGSGGPLTERWHMTLLGYALGGKRSSGAGSTIIAGTASTTSILYVATAAGWVAGDMLAHGSKGDARGDGQVLVVSGITAGSGKIDLLTEAVASSGTTADTISKLILLYHDETASLTTTRWNAMSSDTGAQFHLMGCQLADLRWTIPLDGGGLPKWHWTYNVAYWARQATTFPSALAIQDDFSAPCAGGSFFLANVATKTRTTKTPATLTLELEMPLAPTLGPGGNGTYQVVTAWSRTTVSPALTVQIPWETARETAFDVANQSYTFEHGLFTANPTGGRRWAFYMPSMFYEGRRPSVPENVNDLNYVTSKWRGREGTDTATALTRSAIRFGFG